MKKLKRMLAFMIASVMCLSVIGEIPAKAATEKTTDISWFGGQNGNPWNGSDWTFLTGKDGNFSKMEKYISNDSTTASIKPGWAADADANTAYIGTWRQQATGDQWAVTAFDIAEDGNITGTSGQTLKTSGAGSGDVMVVLKNSDGFYPVWPSKGEWTWQTVADTTGITVDFTTGYKSGDTLYYILKPSEGVDLTRITICPSLTFVGGTATDYPTAFTAFGGDVEVETEVWENHIGWYVTQATQPWTGSYFTFEYLDLSTNEFKQLETHVADASPAYWQDTTGNVVVKGWEHFSTTDKYSAVAFTAGKAGHVKLNTSDGVVKGGIVGGQYAVIQRNGDSYHVLQNWTDVAKGETKNFAEKETYVNEGEVIYYLTRSITSTESANLQINPKVTYTIGAKDTNNLHPSTWGTLNSIVREGKTVDISWFAAQNGNPWPGSPFTFEYFDVTSMSFNQMETYVEDESSSYWQDETGTAIIKAWQQFASNKKYSAVTFTAGEKGVVTLMNNTTVTGKVTDGELMLLQRSGDSYAVLMDWTSIPAGQSFTLPNVETYVEAGDIVYYLYRSKNRTVSVIEMIPGVNYVMGVEDTNSNYPTSWTDLKTVIVGEEHQHTPDITVTENIVARTSIDRVVYCAVCGEEMSRVTIPLLRLSSANLALENDISINFKAKASCIDGYYTNVYAVVRQKLEGDEIRETVIEPVKATDGSTYEFTYKGIAAKEVGDLMDVTIYGTYNDDFIEGETLTDYGVMSYINNQLVGGKIDSNASLSETKKLAFKRLLVDLVNYSSEAQKYFGYKVDSLISGRLPEEFFTYASADSVLNGMKNILDIAYETVENPTVAWKAAGLQMKAKTIIRVKIEYAGNIEDIKMYAKINESEVKEVSTYEVAGTNQYYFYFDELIARQFAETVDFYVMEGDTVVSNTLRYSVETYVVRNAGNDVEAVGKAMMKYSNAAYAYAMDGIQEEKVDRSLFYGVCYCAYEAAVWYGRDVDAELQAMESIGAKSTRVWMRSTHMMSDPQTFKASSVATMKEIIANAQGRGIEVIGMNCNWFSGTDDYMAVPVRNLEEDSDYMKFLADYEETWYQMAKKFPEIVTWEIGNEWNNDTFLHPLNYKENGTTFTASEKAAIATDMLYYASRGIHRGNPNAKTVLGGLVDVYETGYGDAKTFLEMIYANIESGQYSSKNPDKFFEIAAWHPYNHSGTPNAAWVQRQKDIYQVILDHEGHDKVVLFTEIGLSDYGNAEKDAEQKDDVVTTLTLIRDELSFVQSVHWFRMFNDANAESWGGAFETGFGLFTEPDEDGNFEMKAKGEAYLEMTGGK